MQAALAAYALSAVEKTLNVTAITSRSGESVFECWALQPPLAEPFGGGAFNMSLGEVTKASYTILPPHWDDGPHNAPAIQWVVFLSGLAHITIPHKNETVYIIGGTNGLIFAADVADVSASGHVTAYPSEETSRVLQIPTLDGRIPAHDVLHEGPCNLLDM
ncbi:hypothetical protein AURDEDRAFT_69101 [Auricularia subglabra TFB-10046 SS5]|nr:hypothetical protein AURDEDRAFT_69101 [Auricularia subglabra TFB-10046 SS5]